MNVKTLLGALVGAAGVGAAGWWSLDVMVISKIADAREKITAASSQIAAFKQHSGSLERDRQALRALGATALGHDQESVELRLRVALQAIADEVKLTNVKIDSRARDAAPANPAVRELRVLEAMEASPDFRVVSGSLAGVGEPAQVVNTLALLEAQPWPKRVGRLSLTPEDAGRLIRLSLDLETIVLPDLPAGPGPPALAPIGTDLQALVDRFGGRNLFAPPPPKPRKQEPKAPPYGQWRVTALVEASAGAELWLSHTGSGQTKVLSPGQRQYDAVFEGLSGGMAIIRIGESRYRLALGKSLADRDSPAPGK